MITSHPLRTFRPGATIPEWLGGYLIVFVGGGLGAALRHGVNRASLAYWAQPFPVERFS